MCAFPFPVRVAAGLAATAAEQTRELPNNLLGLPVTLVSQALQVSMRVQQQVTELAIKGDEALSTLRTAPEQPEWATFDEDAGPQRPAEGAAAGRSGGGRGRTTGGTGPSALADYDQLTLPQLRGRLRGFSESDLTALLEHERAHGQRAEFVRMLSNRLERLRSGR